MYACCDVIYGIPITKAMCQWFDTADHDLDEFCNLGFETPYSGSGECVVGYLGKQITGFDQGDIIHLDVDKKKISGLETQVMCTDHLGVTQDEHTLIQNQIDEFPEGLKKVIPPIGIYFVWSTS